MIGNKQNLTLCNLSMALFRKKRMFCCNQTNYKMKSDIYYSLTTSQDEEMMMRKSGLLQKKHRSRSKRITKRHSQRRRQRESSVPETEKTSEVEANSNDLDADCIESDDNNQLELDPNHNHNRGHIENQNSDTDQTANRSNDNHAIRNHYNYHYATPNADFFIESYEEHVAEQYAIENDEEPDRESPDFAVKCFQAYFDDLVEKHEILSAIKMSNFQVLWNSDKLDKSNSVKWTFDQQPTENKDDVECEVFARHLLCRPRLCMAAAN